MSDQQHTAEPWKARLSKTIHPNTKMYWLNENTSIGTENEHDASRIVACVNACAGIDTETLEMAAEYNFANDDAEWEPPHPIFKLANERDELLVQVRRGKDLLIEEMNLKDDRTVLAIKLRKQRDELLAALKTIIEVRDNELSDHDRVCFMDESINTGRAAIAKVEAEA